MNRPSIPVSVLALALLPTAHASVLFSFNYDYDTGNFFGTDQRSILESAATTLTSRLQDSLAAIPAPSTLPSPPSPNHNTWTASFTHPSTGANVELDDLLVGENSILVYVGARDLPGSTLGQATSGISFVRGGSVWFDTVLYRGQTGATDNPTTSTDYGPWGGSISFDSATDWHFGYDTVPADSYDFYSVALHELGHLLGLGAAESWNHWVEDGQFIGPESTATHGGNPDLNLGGDHWAEGTTSVLPGTAFGQEAAMTPSIADGTRKHFTDLDWAGLTDVGWQVAPVPEPQEYAMAASIALGLLAGMRRLRRR